MKEPAAVLADGTKIKTCDIIGSTSGMIIRADYLAARTPSKSGTIRGWVGGHGGDVYWVEHDDGTRSAYGWWEFELEAAQ
jgi:hypothetical protein